MSHICAITDILTIPYVTRLREIFIAVFVILATVL